jgi:uncharacterized peroxidase-related enzyme
VTANRAAAAPPPLDEAWRGVDEGWGRRAVDFSTLAEPTNCREYVALHQRLDVNADDELLDVACGSGLAIELAGLRGARCAGIDASERLVQVARDRNPGADLRVGDMRNLPWDDGVFDVVTSFRGIWGTTPEAMAEVYRVLTPGGRVGLTVWGHIKASPGAWALGPFSLAAAPKVENQAAMVALGRPGAGEAFLAEAGFTDVERLDIPFVLEFADPDHYVRALASMGPAFEAMEAVGEEAFVRAAETLGRERVRAGLPLRAAVAVVGYIARKPSRREPVDRSSSIQRNNPRAGFLSGPSPTPEAQRLFDHDVADDGYVTNVSRLWAYMPSALDRLSDLMGQATRVGSLTFRQRAVLVTATASALGDSYCSLAWGKRLASEAGPAAAATVIQGTDDDLDVRERALARWARSVTTDPNGIRADDVQPLRDAGFDDEQIFAITTFVALRLAFSSINDALGIGPDVQLGQSVPAQVRSVVTFGRPLGSVHE